MGVHNPMGSGDLPPLATPLHRSSIRERRILKRLVEHKQDMHGVARTIVLGFILAIVTLLRYHYHFADNQQSVPPLVIINMCKNWCGLGNQMFRRRYAAFATFQALY